MGVPRARGYHPGRRSSDGRRCPQLDVPPEAAGRSATAIGNDRQRPLAVVLGHVRAARVDPVFLLGADVGEEGMRVLSRVNSQPDWQSS